MPTHNEVDYVLVLDVSDNTKLYYYSGYYQHGMPINTQEYTEAVKFPYKDEAQLLCNKINNQKGAFQYHVEEHAYFE